MSLLDLLTLIVLCWISTLLYAVSCYSVKGNMQLIPQHPVLSHPSQRQMRRRPGSQRVLTSEDLRRHQMNKAEPRLEPIAVQPPQKTLQEAAFESIFAASILNQSRSQPGRRVRPDNDLVTYCQGVYKPQQVVFRGSLSAGSGFDDSRTSADMGYHPSSGSRTSADIGYHPSSGSGNESWYGNEWDYVAEKSWPLKFKSHFLQPRQCMHF